MKTHLSRLRGHLLGWVLVFSLVSASRSQVVINEISTGDPADWVELCNLGSSPVDVSGWRILYFEDTQNPFGTGFILPGPPLSGTTIIAPDECIVLTDDPTLAQPVTPPGTQVLYVGFNFVWNVGEPGSVVLSDAQGNGLDYLAHGNPNQFLAPFQTATFFALGNPNPTSTTFSGNASPDSGGLNTLDIHARHSRIDTNSGADFTMRPATDGTPGSLNDFQSVSDLDATTVIAVLSASPLAGVSPLFVSFTNLSIGDCTLVSVTWDFDVANPGTVTASSHNAFHTFVVPPATPPGAAVVFMATLSVTDLCGGTATTLPVGITVTAPDPLVPQVTGLLERFEGPIGATTNSAALPAHGWDVRRPDSASRLRTIDPRTDGAVAAYRDATLMAGPTVAVLDSANPGVLSTTELVLHIDADQIHQTNGSGYYRVKLWLYDNNDEPHPQDVIVFQDGFTLGNGVTASGASTGMPGLDGLQEYLLLDWNTALTPRTWQQFEFGINAFFFATHPSAVAPGTGFSGDNRIIIRQRDNFPFSGGDGLLVDQVQVRDPVTPGPGQPGVVSAALLDVNDAVNSNGNAVSTPNDLNGPFFTVATAGTALVMTFAGESNREIILLSGAMNPGVLSFGPIGTLDIGGPPPMGAVLPIGVTLVAEGTGTGFINSLFRTAMSGTQVMQFITPSLPPGLTTTFQAVIYNGTTTVRMTNAVQMTVE